MRYISGGHQQSRTAPLKHEWIGNTVESDESITVLDFPMIVTRTRRASRTPAIARLRPLVENAYVSTVTHRREALHTAPPVGSPRCTTPSLD